MKNPIVMSNVEPTDEIFHNDRGSWNVTRALRDCKAGKHKIKGAQALQFVRQRHFLPNGDLDRTARQRYFLTQAFRSVVSTGTKPSALAPPISISWPKCRRSFV